MISFGIREEGKDYPVREAAYGLLIDGQKIALVKTPRGIFLPGGGIEAGEDHQACIRRELQEELGLLVEVGAYVLTTRLTDVTPSRDYAIDMVGHCYVIHDRGLKCEAIEEDHQMLWLSLEEACYSLKLPHQAWVIESLLAKGPKKTLSTYNPHWQWWFLTIESHLKKGLELKCSIEHIGSTAIEGMLAKAVIDIDIVIASDRDFEAIKNQLATMGYGHCGDQGIDGRQVFKRSESARDLTLNAIPHHLYVCNESNLELKRHLALRDRLKKDPTLVASYNQLKMSIIDRVGNYNRQAYVEAKASKENRCVFLKLMGCEG